MSHASPRRRRATRSDSCDGGYGDGRGVPVESLDALLAHIETRKSLRLISLGTHFANADVPGDEFTAEQLALVYRRHGFACTSRPSIDPSCGRERGDLFYARCTLRSHKVRPWESPFMELIRNRPPEHGSPATAAGDGLGSSTTCHSRCTGRGVGGIWNYDLAKAPHASRVGLVPIGYGDGYPRSYSNRSRACSVDGHFAPVVGRASVWI